MERQRPENFLELADEEQHNEKLYNICKTTDKSATKPRSKPAIGKIENSDLMMRLSAFLPEMRKANQDLITRDPRTYSIEDDENPEGKTFVEMKLGVGIVGDELDEEKATSGSEAAVSLLKMLPKNFAEELGDSSDDDDVDSSDSDRELEDSDLCPVSSQHLGPSLLESERE